MITDSSIYTTSPALQHPDDSVELPDVKPDPASLGKYKKQRGYSMKLLYEICALCEASVSNKMQHAWQHLARENKDFRFRCSVDECMYGAYVKARIRDHVCTNHRGGSWKDHSPELQKAFEDTFTKCFGEAVKTSRPKETPPIISTIKTRGKTLVVPISTANHQSVAKPVQMPSIKAEPADTYTPSYQRKQHILRLRPRTGRNFITICNLCGKDVMVASAISHIYFHMARELKTYRFVCKMGGCRFGSANREAIMRHLSRDHERPAKKMVEDRSSALVNEVNAYGRIWLGIEEVVRESVKRCRKRRLERDRNGNNVDWREENGTWRPVVNQNAESFMDDSHVGNMQDSFTDSKQYQEDDHCLLNVHDHLLFPISLPWAIGAMRNFACEQGLPPKTVGNILIGVRRHLDSLPNMVEIQLADDQELTICGALNGRFSDLQKIFDLRGYPSEKNLYLFNGDYIGGPPPSIEVVMAMFIFKILYPDYVFINRGNRDSLDLANRFGYHNLFAERYKIEFHSLMNECFKHLPLCHLVNGKIFVVHGGIPSKDGVTLEDIQKIERKCDPDLGGGIMFDLLWSDAMDEPGRKQSDRGGATWSFGPDVTREWCHLNGVEYIVRSNGFKHGSSDPWWVQAGNRCHTIYSSTNVANKGEQGAIGVIRGTSVILESETINADPNRVDDEEEGVDDEDEEVDVVA